MDKGVISLGTKVNKIKANYHLLPSTVESLDRLHIETGLSRSHILDVLVSNFCDSHNTRKECGCAESQAYAED